MPEPAFEESHHCSITQTGWYVLEDLILAFLNQFAIATPSLKQACFTPPPILYQFHWLRLCVVCLLLVFCVLLVWSFRYSSSKFPWFYSPPPPYFHTIIVRSFELTRLQWNALFRSVARPFKPGRLVPV